MACLLLIATSLIANAVDFTVKGITKESEGEPAMYVTVKVYSLSDSVKPIATAVTNDKGAFSRSLKAAGKYRLHLFSVGKTPVNKIFEVSSAQPVADLGTIVLEDADYELGTVEVIATKPLVSLEVDRIGYDVQADEESKTSMLDELLRKVPLVSVDPDGTIKINGSTDFKIYKNGRPNNSYSRNAKEIFKALPASMIEKIEVITEPGAREDAEGVNAILNIVTLKNTVTKGAMGNVSLYYSTPQYFPNPNIWLSAQYDKVALSFYGGLNIRTNKKANESTSTSETVYEQTGDILRSDSEGTSRSFFGYWGLEGSWEADTLNLLTFEFGGYSSRSKSSSFGLTEMFSSNGDRLYHYATRSHTDPSSWTDLNGSVNYQRSTKRKGETIVLSYRLSGTDNRSESESYYEDYDLLPVPYTGILSNEKATGMEHTFQVDWTRPFAKYHTIDIGGKYIYRDNHSNSDREYIGYETNLSEFKHITQVAALFADYRLNIGKFGARAGVRYEYSHLAAKFPDGSDTPFSADLNDWVPNAGLIYNPNRKNSLKLSFGSRIQRPGINYLNPAENITPNATSSGNPDLESVRKNSLTFQYNYMGARFNLGLTANYNFSNNDIIRVTKVEENHTYSTYENAGRLKGFSSRIYANWRPTNKTSLMLSGGVNYNHSRNPITGEKAHGWGNNIYGRFAQTLPWDINLSVWGSSYCSPKGLNSSFRAAGWSNIYYGIDLRKSFLKEKRLSVGIGVNNPVHSKNPGYISKSWADGYHSRTFMALKYYRNFNVSVSYRFGKMSTSVKKVKGGIQNDDVVGGGGGNGNSGSGSSNSGGN